MVAQPASVDLRAGPVAHAIRRERLIVILRRVEPQARLVSLVEELVDAGARIFEVTFDGSSAVEDLLACREILDRTHPGEDEAYVGAGTIRDSGQLTSAAAAGAAFAVSPVLDATVAADAARLGIPFIPGAFSPTEVDRAWRLGATFVKLFPASALGPSFVRELRGPLPEVETIVTGGVDATNGRAFVEAGAAAVGIGSAIVRAGPDERRATVAAIRGVRA
ncbi:MAG TPA: bifunctional 4-hydroxy-2-oxoglutarate aldolase/2-dehydro-3-deoxy-phosphogluconate aldolase [Candidatus Limnocylindrales bacterium]|nr:bifunctional 4-hydroxy-2-oxoglutarate aldolase/2-dehydro-3-deoxy-phosphogluconate aldolase [Candidatus Limnocylindrales bacterium]